MTLGSRNRRYKQVLSKANDSSSSSSCPAFLPLHDHDHEFASMRIMAGIVFCRFCSQSFWHYYFSLVQITFRCGEKESQGGLFAHEISYCNNITQGEQAPTLVSLHSRVRILKEGPPAPSM